MSPRTNGWSSAQLVTRRAVGFGVDDLSQDGNRWPWRRHLLALSAFLTAANTKKTLKTQETALFLQVPRAETVP